MTLVPQLYRNKDIHMHLIVNRTYEQPKKPKTSSPAQQALVRFVFVNQRANVAFLCRHKSQWQTFCTSLKARKRRQLQAEVKPQCLRVPVAALVCKSSHARRKRV